MTRSFLAKDEWKDHKSAHPVYLKVLGRKQKSPENYGGFLKIVEHVKKTLGPLLIMKLEKLGRIWWFSLKNSKKHIFWG